MGDGTHKTGFHEGFRLVYPRSTGSIEQGLRKHFARYMGWHSSFPEVVQVHQSFGFGGIKFKMPSTMRLIKDKLFRGIKNKTYERRQALKSSLSWEIPEAFWKLRDLLDVTGCRMRDGKIAKREFFGTWSESGEKVGTLERQRSRRREYPESGPKILEQIMGPLIYIWISDFPQQKRSKVSEPGVEPETSSVWDWRDNQLHHPDWISNSTTSI